MSVMLRSQGVDICYNVRLGQFDITDGKLDIALELEIADDGNEDDPPEILARLANLDFSSSPSKLTVRDRHDHWDADDGEPHAYVYSGFHHENVSGWIDILSHDEKQLTAEIKIVTDDVERYDETAKDNAFVGKVVLLAHPRDDMWGG